jgi:glycosyltransferase involved in cell wall biosynthesis
VIRVAFNGFFRGQLVGTGRYTDELLRALARDVELRVIEPARSGFGGEDLRKLWFEQVAMPRAARALSPDLVHYPYFAAPARSPAPLIVTAHDVIPLVLPEYRGSPLVRMYMRLQAATVRRARLILTDSNASRHDVVRFLDVPRQRVRVIPLAADPSLTPAPPDEIEAVRRRLRLPERYVLYNGGLDVRKNVPRLILAYARARGSHGVVEPLVVTGNPDQRGALFPPVRSLVEQLGLDKHVRFVGTVREEIRALYSGCALFVYPSRYEGFGLPVLEAMACGAPVACSNASSVPEVAGDAALLFDPEDEAQMAESIARGLAEPEMGKRGLARAAEFSWQKTAAATLQAYRDALEA